MNIKKYMAALVLAPMLMTSCSDSFLDEGNDPNRETGGTFWTSEENVMRGLVAVYNPIRDQMYGYYGAYAGIWNNSMRADDLYPSRGEEAFAWAVLTFNNTPVVAADKDAVIWSKPYVGIQLANEFLHLAPTVDMDAAVLNEMMAEAYFMRGFQYFLLQENFNGAVIRTQTQTVDPEQHGWSSQADVLALCESDFKAAIDALPVTRPAEENGRITKGAAIAMLGKTYLWQGRYAEAKTQFELIMKAPYTYDLVANYEENFMNGSTEFNKESLIEINYDFYGDDGRWGNQIGVNAFMGHCLANFFGPEMPPEKGSGGWHKMQPSAYLVDQFTSEPRPANSDSKWDKRLYTTCYFKYSDYGDTKEDETWYNGATFDDLWMGKALNQAHFSDVDGVPGRFVFKKFSAWWSEAGCGFYVENPEARDYNLRVMRFAEVLFLHAEACLQTGDVSGAMTDINRIRTRAGLAESTITDETEAWTELRKQKLLEFAGENLRWYDLIRWYDDTELKAYLVATKDPGQMPTNYQPKHRYLPIPQSEVDANTALEQTPEWQ